MNNTPSSSNDVVFIGHTAGTALSPMSPSDFYVFFERYVFGGQVIQQFESVPFFDYLFKGEVLRYRPDLTLASHAPTVLIDLDGTISPFRIPSSIWKYAFEEGLFPYQIDSQNTEHHVKVVFVSKKRKVICKASIQVLLLLAQEKFPLPTLGRDQRDTLTEYWVSIYDFLERFESEEFQYLQGDMHLLIDQSKISEFISLVQEKRCMVSSFGEEIWKCSVVEKTIQKYDFTFTWDQVVIRDQAVKDLYQQWRETPWITRCSQLGEKYSYPVFQISAGEQEALITFEKCELRQMESPQIHVVKNFPIELFLLRPLPVRWQEYWYYRIEFPLLQFIQFYRQICHTEIQAVNVNKGVFIFQEVTESESSMSTYIILKAKHVGLGAEGYSAGLYLTTWLLNSYRKEDLRLRLFEFSPHEEIQEYEFTAFKAVCAPWIESLRPQMSDLVQYLRILRTEEFFHLDIALADIFGFPAIRSEWEGQVGFRAIIGAWIPSEKTSSEKEITWVPRFASPEALQAYLVQNFGEEEGDPSFDSSSHPVLALLDEMIEIVEFLNEEKSGQAD
jgi:hypothetical protein